MNPNTVFLFKIVLPLAATLAIIHTLALWKSWYWTFWWMDVVTHVLGGLLIGLILYLVAASFFVSALRVPNVVLFWFVVAGTLCVGILWEMFEFYTGAVLEDRFPDTFLDLLADISGGLIAYTVTWRSRVLARERNDGTT